MQRGTQTDVHRRDEVFVKLFLFSKAFLRCEDMMAFLFSPVCRGDEKPGVCPKLSRNPDRSCTEYCAKDSECDGDQVGKRGT